jgi:hypothetical protein
MMQKLSPCSTEEKVETLKPQDRLGIGGDDRPNPYFNGVGSPSKARNVESMQED